MPEYASLCLWAAAPVTSLPFHQLRRAPLNLESTGMQTGSLHARVRCKPSRAELDDAADATRSRVSKVPRWCNRDLWHLPAFELAGVGWRARHSCHVQTKKHAHGSATLHGVHKVVTETSRAVFAARRDAASADEHVELPE